MAKPGLEGACLLSGHSTPSVLSGKQTWPSGALCSECLVRLGGSSLLGVALPHLSILSPHLQRGTLMGPHGTVLSPQ